MPSSLFVVILHYGPPADTLECVESVLRSDYSPLKAVIVDNDPRHRIEDTASKLFPSVAYLQNQKNLGYAGGNNAGIRWALEQKADYVMILNNDAQLQPDTLSKLIRAAEEDPKATLLAPKIYDHTRRSVINSYGTQLDWFRLRPELAAHGQPDGPSYAASRDAMIVPGSALLMRRGFFQSVGFFNEDFFLIHEDADLCLRNLKAGGRNRVVAEAKAFHKLSRSLAGLQESTAYYSIRNFLYLARAHAGGGDRWKVPMGLFLLSLKKAGEYGFCPLKRAAVRGFFHGVWDYLRGVMGPYGRQAREERATPAAHG